MDAINEILRALGRLEGKPARMDKLDHRVGELELWQAWLKGGWATLAAAYALLCLATFGK